MIKDFAFFTSKGNKIDVSIFGFEKFGNNPCLIFIHGFRGFKDWGYGPFLGDFFARNNFTCITFNFSHNGIGKNFFEITELEKFANNTFSLEIEELNELLSAYLNDYFGKVINKNIFLCGHSRGGAIAILTAKNRNEINAVAIWASVGKLDRYSERQKEKWRKQGYIEVINHSSKQVMKLNISLLNDIEQNKNDKLNIEKAVKELNKSLFIAQGTEDLAVKLSEAEKIYSWSNKKLTEFYKIYQTGHTFDIKHPFEGSNPKFNSLLEKTLKFFINNLK